MSSTALNRTGVALLTNKSGGSVAQGDVVIVDTANANAFTTTTTGGFVNGQIGVVMEPNGIANNASGLVSFGVWIPKLNLNTAATIGQLIKTHTVAKQGTPHSAPMVAGDFAIALEASATPKALMFGFVNQGAGSSGLVFLESQTASASASLDFTSVSDTYNDYLLKITGIIPATAGAHLLMRFATDATPTWDAGNNYRFGIQYWNMVAGNGAIGDGGATSGIRVGHDIATTAGYSFNADIRLSNLRTAALFKSLSSRGEGLNNSDSNLYGYDAIGNWLNNSVKAFGIRLLMSSGNITSGVAKLYGIADS